MGGTEASYGLGFGGLFIGGVVIEVRVAMGLDVQPIVMLTAMRILGSISICGSVGLVSVPTLRWGKVWFNGVLEKDGVWWCLR